MGLRDRLLDATVVASFDRSGWLRHAEAFDPAEMEVDLSGRVCVVTGANRGLGRATTEALAERGATVVMACRSVDEAQRVRSEIVAATGNERLEVREIDLASRDSVRAFVEALPFDAVDVLVHNAGVLPSERVTTDDGLELTVAVHVIGPHRLTIALRNRIRGGRVIWVSSGGMYTKRLDVDTMLDTEGEYDGVQAYAMTKRAQVVLSELWAAELEADGTVVHAMHPGWAATPGVQTSLPKFWKTMEGRLRTPEQGADTIAWLAISERARTSTGKFWFDRGQAKTHRLPFTREREEQRERLWALATSRSS